MRRYDAELHNRIANDPAVYPHLAPLGFVGPLDLSPCAEDRKRFVLLSTGDAAATVFENDGPARWEMHLFMLPSCRGRVAINAGMAMVGFMFRELGAQYIWGKTKADNKAARWYLRKLGGVSMGTRHDQHFGDVEILGCSRDEWEAHSAKYEHQSYL